jgi:hypothetical protein
MPAGKQKLHNKQPANKKNNGNAPARPPGDVVLPPATPIKHTARPQAPLPVTPGGSTLEYKQIQDDEVEALRAIFMEDYTRVERAGAWNVRIVEPYYVESIRIVVNDGKFIRPLTTLSNFI